MRSLRTACVRAQKHGRHTTLKVQGSHSLSSFIEVQGKTLPLHRSSPWLFRAARPDARSLARCHTRTISRPGRWLGARKYTLRTSTIRAILVHRGRYLAVSAPWSQIGPGPAWRSRPIHAHHNWPLSAVDPPCRRSGMHRSAYIQMVEALTHRETI